MFCCLGQSFLPTGHRSNFAGQTHLAKDHPVSRQRSVAQARYHCQEQRQISRGLHDPHTAHHVGKHVLIAHLNASVSVQHREQHRQPVLLKTNRYAPGVTQ